MAAHPEYEDLLAADALGALDAAERLRLEEHLAACAACRERADELLETLAALAYLADPAEPSPAVRAAVLSAVGGDVRARDAGRAGGSSTRSFSANVAGDREDAAVGAADKSNVVPFVGARAHGASSKRRVALIAASLLIAALGGALILTARRALDAERRLGETERRLAVERDRLAERERELARERERGSLFAAPDALVATLAGTPEAPQARARLAMDAQTGRAVLVARDLPRAPAGKAYQLWFIDGARVLPGGVFAGDATGVAVLDDRLPAEAGRVTKDRAARMVFAVTLEPEGGTASPTGAKYLVSTAS